MLRVFVCGGQNSICTMFCGVEDKKEPLRFGLDPNKIVVPGILYFTLWEIQYL